jgi:sec-independent protein translocase protein TatA
MDFSLWQIAIVLVIALIVFGPKRLPELGKSLGSGMREFKDSITGSHKDEDDEKPHIETASQADKVDSEVVTENKA